MNSLYKKSIAIFGMALPLLLAAVLIVIVSAKAGSVKKKYKIQKGIYDQEQLAVKGVSQLREKVAKNAEQLAQWDDLMTRETRGSLIEHLKVAQEQFTSDELKKLSHNWTNQSAGIGSSAVMPASQVKMSFSGTFRAMQLSLLELETKLPQLQLDRMTVTPVKGSNQLQFDTTFTLWTL